MIGNNCDWKPTKLKDGTAGCKCSRCKATIRQADPALCFSRCLKYPQQIPIKFCEHLGEPVHRKDGSAVSVKVVCTGKKGVSFHPVHECGVMGRCLPTFAPNEEKLAAWQERKPDSDIYHLCAGCPHKIAPSTEQQQ